MTDIALSIGIGPVGSFIVAGRRSRDLWWGSSWLAECTAEVAAALVDEGGAVDLLLPNHERLVALRAASMVEGGARRDFGGRVANHVRAVVRSSTTDTIPALLSRVEERAHRWLAARVRACWSRAKQRIDNEAHRDGAAAFPLGDVVDEARFQQQVEAIAKGDFIRMSAGWCPLLPGGDEALGRAMERADEILAMARRTRTFPAASWSREGQRKSNLDPGRDSVLAGRVPRQQRRSATRTRAALGIRRGEQLDAIGFARRIAAFESPVASGHHPELGRLPFPPISRIALDPWLQRASAHHDASAALDQIKGQLLNALRRDRHAFLAWCTPACDPRGRPTERLQGHVFPFDASIFLDGGLAALEEEVRRLGRAESLQDLARLTPLVRRIHATIGLPDPYYALVEADGDGIGQALRAATVDQYRDLVRCLDSYADSVADRIREIIGGRAFYVGGDDVLAVLPLHHLGDGLASMSNHFSEQMESPDFTLSFGVAIAHVKDDLRQVRGEASAALQAAKQARREARASGDIQWEPRGYAEVRELTRSGAPRSCKGPHHELMHALYSLRDGLVTGHISLRTPGLLLDLGRLLPAGTSAAHARLQETAVCLARARVQCQSERSSLTIDRQVGELLDQMQSWPDVVQLAAQIRMAARLAAAGGLR